MVYVLLFGELLIALLLLVVLCVLARLDRHLIEVGLDLGSINMDLVQLQAALTDPQPPDDDPDDGEEHPKAAENVVCTFPNREAA